MLGRSLIKVFKAICAVCSVVYGVNRGSAMLNVLTCTPPLLGPTVALVHPTANRSGTPLHSHRQTTSLAGSVDSERTGIQRFFGYNSLLQ
jgi:hypothetical protein